MIKQDQWKKFLRYTSLIIFVVYQLYKLYAKDQAHEPREIVLIEQGVKIGDKELYWGMTPDEVKAVVGKPLFGSEELWYKYYGYRLSFRDDLDKRYLNSLFLNSNTPNTTLRVHDYTFKYKDDFTNASDYLKTLVEMYNGEMLNGETIIINNHYLLLESRKKYPNQIDNIYVRPLRYQPREVAIHLIEDGFVIEDRRVEFGMTQSEVIAILGEPLSIDEETFIYTNLYEEETFTYTNFYLVFRLIEGTYRLGRVYTLNSIHKKPYIQIGDFMVDLTQSEDDFRASLENNQGESFYFLNQSYMVLYQYRLYQNTLNFIMPGGNDFLIGYNGNITDLQVSNNNTKMNKSSIPIIK